MAVHRIMFRKSVLLALVFVLCAAMAFGQDWMPDEKFEKSGEGSSR